MGTRAVIESSRSIECPIKPPEELKLCLRLFASYYPIQGLCDHATVLMQYPAPSRR